MVKETPRLELNTYEQGDENWSHTDAVEAVDEHAIKRGPIDDRPAEGEYDDALYAAIDQRIIWRWDESESDWKALSGLGTVGNPVPGVSYFESLEADSVSTESAESDRTQVNEFSAERIRDVYRADEAIPLSGVAQIPVSNIGDQGLRNIEVRKGVAYLTDRTHFISYDVSDPLNASELDRIDDIPGIDDGDGTGVNDLVIHGTLCYLSNRYGPSLTIVDISDPENLEIVSSVELDEGDNLYGITYRHSDETVYLCGRDTQSLTSFDVSDPENPIELDHLDDPWLDGLIGVDVIDDEYVIVAGHDSRVTTVDASDPADLSIADSVQDDEILFRADEIIVHRRGVDRDLAYHVGGTMGSPNDKFSVIDIEDPTDVSIRSHVQEDMLAGSVGAALQGNYVYVGRRKSGDDGGAITFDVSDPDNPKAIDHVTVWSQAHDVAVSGDLVYGADPSDGIWVSGANQFLTPEGTEDGKELLRYISTGDTNGFSETVESLPQHDDVYVQFEILTFNVDSGDGTLPLELTLDGVDDGNYDYKMIDEALNIRSETGMDSYELIVSNDDGHRYSGIIEMFYGAARFNFMGQATNTVGSGGYEYIHRRTDSSTVDEPDITLSCDPDATDVELITAVWAVDRSDLS